MMEVSGGDGGVASFAVAKAVVVPTTKEDAQRQAQRQRAQQLEEADPTTYLTHLCRWHAAGATAVRPAAEVVASADSTNGVCLFARDTLELGGRLTGHEDTITRIAFAKHSPAVLWSSSHDGTIRCWDLRAQAMAHTFCGVCVFFSVTLTITVANIPSWWSFS